MNKTILKLTYSGLMTALCFISTAIISFPVPFTNGYIHLGDAFVLSSGVILGKKWGALAAGLGSAMADLYLGYANWALPTFIIKALMAFLIGYLFEDENNVKKLLTFIAGYAAIWAGFNIIVRQLIGADTVMNQADVMVADEVVADAGEVLSLASSTQTTLLIIALGIPLAVIIVLLLSRTNETVSTLINRASAFVVAGSVMVILYYISAAVIYGNWVVPVFSIPANMIQYAAGILIGLLLLPVTKRLSLIEQTA